MRSKRRYAMWNALHSVVFVLPFFLYASHILTKMFTVEMFSSFAMGLTSFYFCFYFVRDRKNIRSAPSRIRGAFKLFREDPALLSAHPIMKRVNIFIMRATSHSIS